MTALSWVVLEVIAQYNLMRPKWEVGEEWAAIQLWILVDLMGMLWWCLR